MANMQNFCFIITFHNFATLEKPAYLPMPKFLADSHYNEEEISRHLKKDIGYWPVQINGNKFATGQILGKPIEVVKGWISVGQAQKSPEPWVDGPIHDPEVSSLLDRKLARWSTASCALALACWPYV
jgi:hypothetical protein